VIVIIVIVIVILLLLLLTLCTTTKNEVVAKVHICMAWVSVMQLCWLIAA